MRRKYAVFCLLLSACGGVESSQANDTTPNTTQDASDDAGECSIVTLCHVTLEPDLTLEPDERRICTRQLFPDFPSAGLYEACLVSPEGDLYLVSQIGGSTEIESPGWTHSEWGGGNVPSSLSATDEARCATAFEAVRSHDAGSDACRLNQ